MQPLLDWFKSHETLMLVLAAASVVMFVAGLVLVPCLVVRLPADYFSSGRQRHNPWAHRHPLWRGLWAVGKNLVGVVLLLAGILMLVLPGQGVLTMLLGVMLLDFPGKYRLERWGVTRKPVLGALNWMRQKAGRGPLVVPPVV